jgi:hypothetical protein
MNLAHVFGLPSAVLQTVAPNLVGKDFYWGGKDRPPKELAIPRPDNPLDLLPFDIERLGVI